ncbi:MAG: AIR synthase-related protein [Bacteroidales bacterium]
MYPGGRLRNYEFIEKSCHFDSSVDYNHKMLVLDAQTSGGLLMAVKPKDVDGVIDELKHLGYPKGCIVGEVLDRNKKSVYIH